jgi:hypothetical protein
MSASAALPLGDFLGGGDALLGDIGQAVDRVQALALGGGLVGAVERFAGLA